MNRPRRLSSALTAARREWRQAGSAPASTPASTAGMDSSGNVASASTAACVASAGNAVDVRGRAVEGPLSEMRRKQYQRFLETYSPDIQNTFADASPEELYNLDRNPTLEQLTGWFGRGPVITWIELQLTRFNDFCGASEKMQAMQIEDLAHLLLANHPKLTICQLANFFARMKSGCYSQFYKSVDPMKIASSLRVYAEEQSVAWQRLRDREEQVRKEREEAASRARCITYEQYLELKRQGLV